MSRLAGYRADVQIGFFAPHVGRSSRDGIARACDVVDELGADILWAVDHIAFPYGFKAVYPYATHEFGESPDNPLEWWACTSVLTYAACRLPARRAGAATVGVVCRMRPVVARRKAMVRLSAHDARFPVQRHSIHARGARLYLEGSLTAAMAGCRRLCAWLLAELVGR